MLAPLLVCSLVLCVQITYQLNTYLQRVEAVLGKGWENHVEGQKLKADGDAFRQKLNTQSLFEEWKKKVCDSWGVVLCLISACSVACTV